MTAPATPQPQKITIPAWQGEIHTLGNPALLNLPLTAFLCSQQYPVKAVLPAYEWARTARNTGSCVISGFHSPLECDVRDILLNGKQPLVWAVARALPRRLLANIKPAIAAERLLIVSPVSQTEKFPTRKNATIRNRFIVTVARQVIIAHATPDGELEQFLSLAKTQQLNA